MLWKNEDETEKSLSHLIVGMMIVKDQEKNSNL